MCEQLLAARAYFGRRVIKYLNNFNQFELKKNPLCK